MPVVADRFYPGDPARLRAAMDLLVPEVAGAKKPALAVVLPHAGYVYSGATAGRTVRTVVILGPNHHGRGAALALGTEEWRMPMGTVPVDRQLAAAILERSTAIVADEEAHASEHSLEVQIPFLQQVQPHLQIVPIVVGHLPYGVCQAAARDLAGAIASHPKPVLLVASTDMSHYESRRQASRKDRLAIERILALDPRGLYDTVIGQRISMCGIMPTTIVLLAALELGATRAELVEYTDSGAASGDTDQVVGYAGLIVD
jgi:AmmeMemoRadiSam system protein B